MKSFYLENHDAFMRYLETPQEGQAIVYLPAISFSAAASFFDVVTHPDMPRHRALLVDYLGSGASDHPDDFDYSLAGHAACIAALMDSAGIQGATVMGHSMGGSVAIQLAITRPDLVGNLIVGESNVTSGGGGLVRQIVAHNEAEFVGSAFPKMQAEIFASARNGDTISIRRSNVWAHVSANGLYRNAQALNNVPDSMLEDFLALPMKRTFVFGEKTYPDTPDALGPDTPSPDLLRANGCGIEVVPGAGHGQMFDNLGGFVDIVAKVAF
ncbi:alpha/beta hydrolase [Yoonia sediminilitoris]|uniref:Pimeloyl-ACP methyl ester carboxylesterase n=1 Tax=Yoonia sediminilitoris TaxID=1286148 RepID=A0A2T6K4E8_9RHOB|nr:alpha/beta hydrolase [Yoonia sediminilitoris]PUB09491.1 pimeloyl-ACP methyl ester carboxylesterase [Yoonia sediminilitoris]RCW89484.1 pimeloyl-ACP methyl ester carboxylesterase [Yoonia sediminilitoris]